MYCSIIDWYCECFSWAQAWQRRKKYAFDKLTDLTLLDLENTYFALFISRRNREGDKFSYDGWYSEGAGREFVTTGDVEAIWKSFVKKHHKRKVCSLHGCDVVGEIEGGTSSLELHLSKTRQMEG